MNIYQALNSCTMKSTKQAIFILTGSLISTLSFAQVNLGVTNSTRAAIHNSVNVGNTAATATNAAAQTTTAATAATRQTVSATRSKALEAGNSTSTAAINKTMQSTEVKAGAQVNAQAADNSTVFVAKAGNETNLGVDAATQVNGSQVITGVEKGTAKAKTKVETTTDGTVAKVKETSVDTKTKVKTTAHYATEKVEDTDIEGKADVKSETTANATKQ